ncbi:MAG: acetaldehyde dehydrogenase (acetylating) [Clostridia bacterium]|nr:acetaldehyde dehydrogenase (acetylating) [Clostridia bacterium]
MADQDLASIEEARALVEKASKAQARLLDFTQADIDRVCERMARAGFENAGKLAAMAVEETGIGVVRDKVTKNEFASKTVWEHIKPLRTVGFISEDRNRKVAEIAVPLGVIAGLLPTTNPTSTAIFKALIAVKSRNAIVFSPHPRAAKCTFEAARIMSAAAIEAGAPDGLVNCIERPTMEATDELMHHKLVAAILATGGTAMVRAAYSSGKPAFGVGPGNVPAFIERTADVRQAVANILASKSFDNGTICASEQAIVAEIAVEAEVLRELSAQGAYICDEREKAALERTVMMPNGGMSAAVVGKSAAFIGRLAGITVPDGARVLIARCSGVGREHPLSAEKLCPVLGFYTEATWEAACERCIELLNYGGLGHSLVIHSRNEGVIREFALKKPVNRILVNTPSSMGGIGLSTGLDPSLTLGCGSWGGNITSDNVGPLHLINKKRLAYHLGGIEVVPQTASTMVPGWNAPRPVPVPGFATGSATGREPVPGFATGSATGRGRVLQATAAEREALRRLDDATIARLVDAALAGML